ncbi:MAG TPA: nucleoside deaminase [Bacteroidales bacterium]|nr:nucleoside deaminase [Bacteroidales bacterium]
MDLVYFSDETFMKEALKEAVKAYDEDEVPVGAVVVCQNKVIARAHNLTERLNDVTAHAEMQAITAAANFLGSKYLTDCTLYVTLEPCVMCAGALFWSQISRVVYAAGDPKRGYTLINATVLHPKTKAEGGLMQDEAARLMEEFFKKKR